LEEGYAYARNRGLNVVGEYVDGGVSGKYANRPRLDRLMAECRAGLIDVVIVSKHDRFGRSFRHTVSLIGELEELGVEFVSIAERIDDTPSGRFQRNVLLSVAEFERERILERTVGGMEATARAGHWPAGPAPLGWKLVKDSSGTRLALNAPEVAIWELIVSCMVDKRMSSLEAARALNAAGLRRRSGKVWSANSLWDIVRDTTCLSGTWTYRPEGGRNGRRPKSGPPLTVSVPPILTSERHEALKAVIAARSWTRKQTKHPWLLSLRLFSPHGRRMHGMHDARGHRRYRCPGKIMPDGGRGGGGCECFQVHADDLEALVWRVVTDALSKPDMLLALAEEQAQASATASDINQDDLASLDHKIARLERAAGEQLAKALAAGADPKVAAIAAVSLKEEIEAARERRKAVAAWAANVAERRSRADILAGIANDAARALLADGNIATKQRILEALSVEVTVTGWRACPSCGGTGRLKGANAKMCSGCHGMRLVTEVEIEGAIPVAEAEKAAEAWPVKLVAS